MIELLLQAERALEMGRIDAAETLYHQVADNDPRNAIAVVGLARVALERGDERAALDLARRALVIDPENAAAGRMVARLEEVAAYRGEAVPTETTVATVPTETPVEASGTAEGSVTVEVPVPVQVPTAVEPPPAFGSAPWPASAPVIAPIAEPADRVAPDPPIIATPSKRRRSWIDRLLRRHR